MQFDGNMKIFCHEIFFSILAGLASMKVVPDAAQTYTVLRLHSDEQHTPFSSHFMSKLARNRLAKMRKIEAVYGFPRAATSINKHGQIDYAAIEVVKPVFTIIQ